MKMVVKKTTEGIEYNVEDATIEDCIKLVKALENSKPEDTPCRVYHVPSGILTASGYELDKWGIVLDLSRGFLETDNAYRERLTNKLTGN